MKTALLLAGQLRSFKACYPTLRQHILEVVHPDIFMSTWVLDKPLWHSATSKFMFDSGTVDEAVKLYKPNALSARAYTKYWREYFGFPQYEAKRIQYNTSVENCMAMFWHWKTVYELFQPYATEYDTVILSRFDVSYNTDFPAQEIQQQLKVHLPILIPWGLPSQGAFIDLLAVGNNTSIKLMTLLFDKVKEYIDAGVAFHPETLLLHHCKKHLSLQRFTFPTWVVRHE